VHREPAAQGGHWQHEHRTGGLPNQPLIRGIVARATRQGIRHDRQWAAIPFPHDDGAYQGCHDHQRATTYPPGRTRCPDGGKHGERQDGHYAEPCRHAHRVKERQMHREPLVHFRNRQRVAPRARFRPKRREHGGDRQCEIGPAPPCHQSPPAHRDQGDCCEREDDKAGKEVSFILGHCAQPPSRGQGRVHVHIRPQVGTVGHEIAWCGFTRDPHVVIGHDC